MHYSTPNIIIVRSIRTLSLLLFVSLFALGLHAQTTVARPFIKVTGDVTKPLTLYTNELAGMKQETVPYKEKDGKILQYSGVPLMDILTLSGVAMGKELRGPNLSKYMLVKCTDGYKVIFSLAELDSSFIDRRPVLVYEYEGKPLPAAQGPFRLIIPGEKLPARSCRMVSEIVVRSVKD